jgi:hypothetical protein
MGKFHLPVYGLDGNVDKKNLTGFLLSPFHTDSGAQKPDGHRLSTSFFMSSFYHPHQIQQVSSQLLCLPRQPYANSLF